MLFNFVSIQIEEVFKPKRPEYLVCVKEYTQSKMAVIDSKLFPKFKSLLDAYIFCVGIAESLYANEAVYFSSTDPFLIDRAKGYLERYKKAMEDKWK